MMGGVDVVINSTQIKKRPRGYANLDEQQRLNAYRTRFRKAQSVADQWISLQEACYHYCIPQRDLFYWTSQTQGAQKNALVYDTTAVAGVRNFVSKIQNALTPPQQTWAMLAAGTSVPEENTEEVNDYLQETNKIIFDHLRHSNFDLAINECYYDLAVGTAALCLNEGPDDNPLIFYSNNLARIAIEESFNTSVETVFRWWDEMRIGDIMERWPNATITQTMQMMYEQDKSAVVKMLTEGTIYDYKTKTYTYALWYNAEMLLEEEVECSNWIVFRWTKVNNEAYGRGPIMEALPSVLSLNELARLELAAANLNVCRPFMAFSDGVFNPWTFRLEANTVIPIAPNSSGVFPLQPLPATAQPEFYQLTATDLRTQINTLLFNQPFGPIDAPPKTATEVAARQRNLYEEIGPVYTRLQSEFLARLIKRIVYILQRKNKVRKLEINGHEIMLTYQSPLVYAQGQQDVNTFMQWFQTLAQVQGPEAAAQNVNPTLFPQWLGEKLGVDSSVLNSPEQMTDLFQQQLAQRQQVQQIALQQAEQGAPVQ